MVLLKLIPEESGFKLIKTMFHEAIEFSLPMTKNFTFICLEDPRLAQN